MANGWLGLAVWNTAVAVVNTTVLPMIWGPGITDMMTPLSQVLPVFLPLTFWAWSR